MGFPTVYNLIAIRANAGKREKGIRIMEFLEIERRNETQAFNMSYTQFHDYYEIYFLLSGERELFIENRLYLLHSGSIGVIPPFSMHKTEGSAYERVNVYVSKKLLDDNENAFLMKISETGAFSLSREQMQFIFPLIKEASATKAADASQKYNFLISVTRTVISYLQMQTLQPLPPTGATYNSKHSDTLIMHVVAFINKEYRQKLTLETLQKQFYISKNTLCRRFQEQMNCSPIQYVTHIRLNKAKMYLSSTDKSVSEIAELCGFPSANYLGIIFKKQIGISPLNYRKKR